MEGEIYQRIRILRKELNLTQVKFSRLISLSAGQVACLETGRRVVNDRTIKLICNTFNVSEKWLRSGEGEIFIPNEDEKFTKLAALFADIKPQYQDFILNAIDLFLKMQENEQREIHSNLIQQE